MQRVLDEVDSPDLRVLVVWEPILASDVEGTAPPATALIPDPRAEHFWTPDLELARAWKEPLGLTGQVAWDVYLGFGRAARWRSAAPPRPDWFQHQLYGLPDSTRLDEAKLASRLRALLDT